MLKETIKSTKAVQVENQILGEFNTAIGQMKTTLEQEENKLTALQGEITALEQKIKANYDLIDRMTSGAEAMDVNKYNTAKKEIEADTKELQIKQDNVNDFYVYLAEISEAMKKATYNQYKDTVSSEYESNKLAIKKEMFKKMKEVVELSEQLTEETEKYKNASFNLGYDKAYMYFEPSLLPLINRFIMTASKIKYSQHMTDKLYDFEQ